MKVAANHLHLLLGSALLLHTLPLITAETDYTWYVFQWGSEVTSCETGQGIADTWDTEVEYDSDGNSRLWAWVNACKDCVTGEFRNKQDDFYSTTFGGVLAGADGYFPWCDECPDGTVSNSDLSDCDELSFEVSGASSSSITLEMTYAGGVFTEFDILTYRYETRMSTELVSDSKIQVSVSCT